MSDDTDLAGADRQFAGNFRAARERMGLSQGDVAREMTNLGFRMLQQTIARIEGADRVVSVGEARALAWIVKSTVDALSRPAGLARQAWLILDAARRVRQGRDDAESARRRCAAGRADLERLIGQAESAGHGEALADEMAAGRRALADTTRYAQGAG